MPVPPLPQGFTLSNGPPQNPDLLKPLFDLGIEPTNGYRAPGDTKRLRQQGYTPADHSGHLVGDDVDLTPGKSGLSLAQLHARANAIASNWPGGKAEIHNGSHVHMALPGWGMAPGTPGTPNFGLPPLPHGMTLERRGSLKGQPGMFAASTSKGSLNASTALATGQVHDGDTLRLTTGHNARIFGADAYELNQQGRRPDNSLLSLGHDARDFMASRMSPDTPVHPTGAQTYGRPVVTLGSEGNDPARDMLRLGYGLAEPHYLKGSPQFAPYMEAERLARLNRLGGHGTNAETPSQFRHKDGPWKGTEPGVYGHGANAVFADEPTPFQGLRPEIAQGYLTIWNDPKSKPEDLVAYAKANGFTIDPGQTAKAYEHRDDPEHYQATNRLSYKEAPRPLIDPGDGAFGSFARGFGDPVNMIDELGGVVDSVGLTPGRENIWNSGRRWGDIWANDTDQNRAILAHDDAEHPVARIGGQLTSGVALPMGAASSPLRLGAIMAAEGGIAGAAGGEGGFTERFLGAVLGTVIGAAAGPVLGLAGEHLIAPAARSLAAAARRASGRGGEPVAEAAVREASSQPQGSGSAAMAAQRGDELVGPVGRQPDRIDVTGAPPPPEGFKLADNPFDVTRPINERLSAEEMAKLAEDVDPAGAVPRPANEVASLEESIKANPGRFVELQAPDEFKALPVRTLTSRTGGKVRVRGPLDITQSIRHMGGVKDNGGDLAHLGITNDPRRMDFGSNEQFLGKLIDNENGHSVEDAAHALWEEGYFPEFSERPSAADLIDRLHTESTGGHRYFHPDALDEVHDFHAAQGENSRINEAADKGHPLVDERGHSVNLDDLVASTPPANAYEETPRLTGKIGNINLDYIANNADVAALIDQVAKRVGGFSAAARGRITHEETQRLAVDMGIKPEQLLKRQQGQALNAEQLFAARNLVQRSREVVGRMAKKAIGGSDDDLADFRAAWLRHVALEEQVSGASAEAGRALGQMRMIAKGSNARGDAVRDYLKASGGRESIEEAAQAIVDLMEDPAKASHFMREAVKPRWRDKFNELWVNSLLSGPRTHVVNFVGNALTTALSFPEQALTAGIGSLTRSADRAYLGEVSARAVGLADSSIDALRNMRAAFKSGEAADSTSKIDAVHQRAIGGKLGQFVRIPTRALTAADEFWKTLLGSAELRQLSYRKAAREATSRDDFKARYEALLHNPPDELVKQAQASARYYTFQKELGPVGRGIQQVSNNSIVGKILLPFVRTPSNILKFAGERSAFGLAMPEVRQALRAGGRQRDEALARITLGSGLSTAAVVAAIDGRVSGGGPSDPHERAALLQSGWQPYSIRIGGSWYSFQRFDPVSTLIGVAADFAEAGKWATKQEADVIAMNLATGIAKNITNKTWLSGLSDAFDVLSDPDRYGKAYVQRLAAAMAVPALVSQTAQAMDPSLRDARTVMDAIKARVPVLSESVPVRRNIWGEPVSKGDAVGPDIVSPFYASEIKTAPVNLEVARLRVPLSMPQRHLTIEGQRVELNPLQYDDLVQLAGQPAKKAIEQQMSSPVWRSMSDADRSEFVKDTLAEFRDSARQALLDRHPELQRVAAMPGGRSMPTTPNALPPPPPGFTLAH